MDPQSESDQFLKHLRPLERQLELYARQMLRDPSKAEDVLQDAVLNAYRQFSKFSPGTNFRAWVFRILMHGVLNANRRHEPVRLSEIPGDLECEPAANPKDAEPAFATLLSEPDRMLELLEGPIARALGQLSPAERSCLLLKSVGELSYQEIHEVMEIPVGSVMGYLSRARAQMRKLLGDYVTKQGWLREEPMQDAVQPEPEVGGEQP